jgi:ribosomal protein S18 acetylase RimI-like enzyme
MTRNPVVSIRPYRPADQAAVLALHGRTPVTGSPSPAPHPQPVDLERIAETYLGFWVAVEYAEGTERVVGMVGVKPPDSYVPALVLQGKRGVVQLKRMRVAPERQGLGIGTRLTETAIGWVRERGFTVLVLETGPQQATAIRLYSRTGFTEVSRSTVGLFDLVWFELRLDREVAVQS